MTDIVIGMGCTVGLGSDRKAGTLIEVLKVGKSQILKVQEDKSIKVSGWGEDGSIEYRYESDPEGHIMYFKQDKGGYWVDVWKSKESGRWLYNRCKTLGLGHRSTYRDPHF